MRHPGDAVNPKTKARYRRLRNFWGWVIAIGWIALWYTKLSADHAALVASLGNCAGLFASISCSAQRTASSLNVAGGTILAVVTSPFAFVVSHYIARPIAEGQQSADERRAARAAKIESERDQQERRARIEQSETSALSARLALDRKEFIRKLGTANDALDLQDAETDPGRLGIARQAVNAALRDLNAKHTLAEMASLIASDEGVMLASNALIIRLKKRGPLSSDAAILERALAQQSLHYVEQ